MNNPFRKLLDTLENRGVQSGLNQTQNSIKMAGYIVGPLIASFFLIRFLLPVELGDTVQIVAFVVWIGGVILYFFKVQAQIVTYTAFPQSHWRFPDGQQIAYDLLVPPAPNDYKLEASYKDGSKLYTVHFKNKLAYQDPRREYMDIFDKALWKIPAEWTKSFDFNALGEMFFEGFFTTHSKSENVEVSVIGWAEGEGTRLPYCVVTSCSEYYRRLIAGGGKAQPNQKDKGTSLVGTLKAEILTLKKDNKELKEHNSMLEIELEQTTQKAPQDIKKLSDKRLERVRKEIGDIMDTERSWKEWLIVNGKYLSASLFFIAMVYFGGHALAWW